jgi:hypothetical protein
MNTDHSSAEISSETIRIQSFSSGFHIHAEKPPRCWSYNAIGYKKARTDFPELKQSSKI